MTQDRTAERGKSVAVLPLSGRWLTVARAAWAFLTLLAVAVLLSSLPGYAEGLSAALDRVGVQGPWAGTAVLMIASRLASLASAGLSLALATVFFRQRFIDPVAATLSVYLVLYAVIMAGPLEVWSSYWLGDSSLASTLQAVLLAGPTVALLALFPNGRFVPAWTVWLLVLTIPWNITLFLVPSFEAEALSELSPLVLWLLAGSLIALTAAGLYAQVIRYRKVSSSAERQQTKWVVYGVGLWVVCLLVASIPYIYLGGQPSEAPRPWWEPVSTLGWFLSLSILPTSLAIAVARYQLWDIDLVINRTLVYGTLTACVLAIYALVVGGMGVLFQAQGNWVLTLLATGLVAVLVQPLRERLQRGVNRMLYGHRDEPFDVLARLGQRLEDTLAPELVIPTLVETVAQTLKLPYVAIAIGEGEELRTTESFGKPTGLTFPYPLSYRGEAIGQLLVASRSPGEAFTASEERLLRNIARQAGTAVYALRLTADLQHARQQVVAGREEERRRLRRDLHDGLGPSLAAQMLKLGSARALLADRPEMADRLLAEMETDIEGTLADVRRIVYDLRPAALDQLGLAGALRAFAEGVEGGEVGEADPNLVIRIEVPEELPPLAAAVEVAAYHIGREALTNVVRHAGARHCWLRLTVSDGAENVLRLSVEDDGPGLSGSEGFGIGLSSMRERAAELGGTCTIEPRAEGGTRVAAGLPLVS